MSITWSPRHIKILTSLAIIVDYVVDNEIPTMHIIYMDTLKTYSVRAMKQRKGLMMLIWSVNMYLLKWFGPVLLCRVTLHSFIFQIFTLVTSLILFYVLLSHWADSDSSIIFHRRLPPVTYYITALYNSGCSANSN